MRLSLLLAFLPAASGLSAFGGRTGMAALDPAVVSRYASLTVPASAGIRAEYIWLDAVGNPRSKSRTLPAVPGSVDKLPRWNYDGSSCDQAPGEDSEVIIRPRAMFKDPFRPNEDNILVLCDAYTPAGKPIETNNRHDAAVLFDHHAGEEVWFGCEQEYTLFELDQVTPLGWPKGGFPGPQGP